jgi:hypothetical protein
MSGDDRDEVLRRIRAALGGRPDRGPEPMGAGDYLERADASREELVALFIERAAEYRALVRRVARGGAPRAGAPAAAGRRAGS